MPYYLINRFLAKDQNLSVDEELSLLELIEIVNVVMLVATEHHRTPLNNAQRPPSLF